MVTLGSHLRDVVRLQPWIILLDRETTTVYHAKQPAFWTMYTSLTWVPRGKAEAKLDLPATEPPPHENGADNPQPMDADTPADEAMETPNETMNGDDADGDVKPDASLFMDDDDDDKSEVDIDEVLANDLDNLRFYKSNKDDPLLKDGERDDGFDEEELDELRIRPTDALLIATKSGEEASHLEYHLFDDNPDDSDDEATEEYVPNSYVHHDMVLPTIPLCCAYTSLSTEENPDAFHNLVAVGMFTPGIDIWDVDDVHALTPINSMGGYNVVKKKKTPGGAGKKRKSNKKPRLQLKEDSHEDAVLSLSWNHVQKEYLASGSADHTVKIWDIESSHCACTLRHHGDKVQSVKFHPTNESLLVTGGFDKAVHVVDLREQKSTGSWSVDADVESVHWFGAGNNSVLVATEAGTMYEFDRRTVSSSEPAEPVVKWAAHTGAVSACTVSADIPGLLVTGSVDKRVKVWNVESANAKLLLDLPSKVGAVFSAAFCPTPSSEGNKNSSASPFVLAYGGQKADVEIVDLGIENKEFRNHYQQHVSGQAFKALERRAARVSNCSLKKLRQMRIAADEDENK